MLNSRNARSPVGAGVPAKGRKAAPNYLTDWHYPHGRFFYLRASRVARRGAGRPSMVLLWSFGSRKSAKDW
ncbi:hypothetical protein DMX12_01120 [Pseudomonas sp. MB-090624]|nr:hypothetical protein DMX12_01120 [Pseudomonas sp. MB-090624]